MNDQEKIRIHELVLKSFDETITPQECRELESLVAGSPGARACYQQCMDMIFGMEKTRELINRKLEMGLTLESITSAGLDLPSPQKGSLPESLTEIHLKNDKDQILSDIIEQDLIDRERGSEAKTGPDNHTRQNGFGRSQSRKPLSNKDRILFIARFAAIVLIAVSVVVLDRWFQRLANQPRQVVATLNDQIDAQWDKAYEVPMDEGDMVQGYYHLTGGFAKIDFHNGAVVVLEGPAELRLNAEDNLLLHSGKAYARVPEEAIGFSINTEQAKIIDLGTEFGVHVNESRNLELHVLQGETLLIAGKSGAGKDTRKVQTGQAREVDTNTNRIRPIEINENAFARAIHSKTKHIWRGRPFSLASVVAGGDGFSRGQPQTGIDPASGGIHLSGKHGNDRYGSGVYSPVPDRPFVDGVFVPNGDDDVIASTGLTYEGFPTTHNNYWSDISAYPQTIASIYNYNFNQYNQMVANLTFDKEVTAQRTSQSVLYMHANSGITFDLTSIRQFLGPVEIARFTAFCGLPNTIPEVEDALKSEFWVLLDGECVFHHRYERIDSRIQPIYVPIKSTHRFLTLAATDGGDHIGFDWCVFGDPELCLRNQYTASD